MNGELYTVEKAQSRRLPSRSERAAIAAIRSCAVASRPFRLPLSSDWRVTADLGGIEVGGSSLSAGTVAGNQKLLDRATREDNADEHGNS